MKLSEYLEAHGLTYAEFARMIDVKGNETVRRYAEGIRTPDKKRMAQIAEVTGFQVTANDFHGITA